MIDLTVPQLKLFSQPPTFNEYRHNSRRQHHSEREYRRSADKRKYADKTHRYEHPPVIQERLLARQTPIAHLVDHLLPNVIEQVPYIRHVQPIPIPIARQIPLVPMPIPRRSRQRLDTYYEMSKMVLNDAIANPMLQTFKPRQSRSRSSSRQKNSSFSIVRQPYLTEGTIQKRYEKSEEKKESRREEPKKSQEPQQPPRVTPKHTPKGITVISAVEHTSPKPQPSPSQPNNPSSNASQYNPPPNPQPNNPPALTLQSFNELFSLFKDVIEHQRLNMQHLRQEHQKQWMSMLEVIKKLKKQEQQKELRKRIKEWKRRVFPLQQSIIENVSTYTQINNDSMVRRDFRQIDQKKIQFEARLNEVLQTIDQFDFSLQRSMKLKQQVNISEIVRLKNQDMGLYRECIGKIQNLIVQYDSKPNKSGIAFSYFQ